MNRADLELLDNAIDNLGNSFQRNRQMAQQNQIAQTELSQRQQQIDQQARATALEQAMRTQEYASNQAHQQRLEDLQMARNDLARGAQVNQQNAQDLAAKQDLLRNVIQLNATGTLDNLDDVNDWLSTDPHFKQTGIQLQKPPTQATPQAGQNSVAAALQHADLYRQQGAAAKNAGDDATAERMDGYADLLENSIDPSAYQTVTQTVGADPATGKGGTTITKKVPTVRGSGKGTAGPISPQGFQQWMQNQQSTGASAPGSASIPGVTPPAPSMLATPSASIPGVTPPAPSMLATPSAGADNPFAIPH